MAPNAFHQTRIALKNGLAWGLGHSVGVLALSTFAILINDLAHIEWMSSLAEFTVGVALLFGGILAIKASLKLKIHNHEHNHKNRDGHQHIHLHFLDQKNHRSHSHYATGLGLLHGLAGGGHLLAVLPALALPPTEAISYMIAYLFGSVASMSLLLMAISLTRLKAGWRISLLIVGIAGGLSIAIGIFWLKETTGQLV